MNRKLQILVEHLTEQPEISVTYFQLDTRKAGGEYVTVTGTVKKIDDFEGIIVLRSGEQIAFERILGIESDLFKVY